ncbi:MAG: hypothetical protein IT233_05310 [Bacteroidia bacterium]|nr:hypothetical protein [Bacteroidia bacterium]
MKLIIFTPEGSMLGETEMLVSMLEAGLQHVHVRKPDWDITQMRTYLSRIPSRFHQRIAVHSFSEQLAPEFDLRCLHFTQKQRESTSPFEWELLREKGFLLSTSVHSIQELESCKPFFPRLFLGPVFNSISKKEYAGKTFPMLPPHPGSEIIGIGGVKNSNLLVLSELGYDGGAMLGWIWENPADALKRYLTIHTKWALHDHLH